MLDPLVDLLKSNTPIPSPWGRVLVIVSLFATAWLVSRMSALVALRVLAWHDRRHQESDLEATGRIADLKRRETLVSVIRTGIAYAVFIERWYSVGDTVVLVAGLELQGVVEDVSLRRTKLRSLNGEVIQVHNSQITAARVLPRGVKELAVELFVNKGEDGEQLVREVARILPEGPTTFVKRPWISHVEEFSPVLTRIRLHTTVAPGREWLVEGFFSDLLRQRASNGLIVHGPVTLAVDERATRSFARASATTRRTFERAPAAGAGAGV
jgi:hypothetical protein